MPLLVLPRAPPYPQLLNYEGNALHDKFADVLAALKWRQEAQAAFCGTSTDMRDPAFALYESSFLDLGSSGGNLPLAVAIARKATTSYGAEHDAEYVFSICVLCAAPYLHPP